MDAALIQWIITGLLVPAGGVAFWLLQRRIDRVEEFNEKKREEIWDKIDETGKALANYKVEAERRFVSIDALAGLKKDLDKRLDAIAEKLDWLGRRGGDRS